MCTPVENDHVEPLKAVFCEFTNIPRPTNTVYRVFGNNAEASSIVARLPLVLTVSLVTVKEATTALVEALTMVMVPVAPFVMAVSKSIVRLAGGATSVAPPAGVRVTISGGTRWVGIVVKAVPPRP